MSGKPEKLEDTLINKLHKEIEDHSRQAGKKVIDQQVEDRLHKLDEESDSRVGGFRNKMKRGLEKFKLNLHATVLFLLCLQLTVCFFLLLLMYLFSFILALLLIWVLMFVGCVYCGSYCLISRYPNHFKKSSSTFVICLTLAVCEGIVLCFMAMTISTEVFLVEVSMLIIAMFTTCLLAKCLHRRYKAKSGLMMALMTTAVMYIVFFFLLSGIRVWMTVCTLLLCGYEWFLVFKVSAIIRELEENEEEDRFQTGLFASLLIFKAKIDFFVKIGAFIAAKCCKKKEEPANTV
jgi:hypothetical protein